MLAISIALTNVKGHYGRGVFKASLVDSDAYLFTWLRYIELNPVRENMVEHPGQYGWSSYACNASGKDDVLVQPHPLYAALDNKPGQRQCAYRESFCMHLEDDEVHAIRDALNQQLVLGREDFKDKIEKMTNRQTRPRPLACPGVEEDEAVYF